jgi:hypothetical protein
MLIGFRFTFDARTMQKIQVNYKKNSERVETTGNIVMPPGFLMFMTDIIV